jgi:hypothetical protein
MPAGTIIKRSAVAAVCLLATLAPGCARRGPTAADVVRGSGLRFLPADTAGVAIIEVARIKDRDALAQWLGEAAGGLFGGTVPESVAALLRSDLIKQVDRVALALVPDTRTPPGWAALVEGRFDPRMLSAGDGIVPLVSLSSGLEIGVTALPGGGVAIGPPSVLGRIRASADSERPGLASAQVMPFLGTVSPAADAWGAIDYAPLTEITGAALGSGGHGLSLPSPKSPGALRGVAFEGRLEAEVSFTLVGVADAETGAKRLADGARGLVALARMGASQGKDPSWLDFLDGLSIDQTSAEVRVHGKVSRSMLQALSARVTAPGGEAPSGSAEAGAPAPAGPGAPAQASPAAGEKPSGAAARAVPGAAAPSSGAARPD